MIVFSPSPFRERWEGREAILATTEVGTLRDAF
jgi:hypothetical protein